MGFSTVKLKPLSELISLRGKKALITGAASGIGEAIALRFAEAGAYLYLVDINEEGLKAVAGKVSELGVGAEVFKVDLSRKEEIDRLWVSLRGREPDILVNNAGIYLFKDFLEVDEGFLEKVMNVNLTAVFWMCQYMIKTRKDKGGIIINIGSIEAILPFAEGLVHYDVAKAGLLALTRALAKEYGRNSFRINAIIPGGIKTTSVEKLRREALLKMRVDVIKTGINFMNRLPLGRMGDPDEVARVVVFLASELSSYVHGTFIPVDGGFLSA